MAEDVKLHGAWTSPYSYKVIWALKLKGIPFDYIEEDLSNKSDLLLRYNPVHKKIPVLVHGGRPICESTVIIEYLDEKWPQNPLLPSDPYERAMARSWVTLAHERGPNIGMLYRITGEEQEKVKQNILEMLTILEEHGPNKGKQFFGGENINIIDIAFGNVAYWMQIIEEVSEVKLFDSGKFPRLKEWSQNFKKSSVISENLPDYEKLLTCLKRRRELLFGSP